MRDKKRRKEIITSIVELMKDKANFQDIKRTIEKRYELTENEAEEYVKIAFETVSYLEREIQLTRAEKIRIAMTGLIVSVILALLYSYITIKTKLGLYFLYIVFAYIISASLYHMSNKRTGIFLEILSAMLVIFIYVTGEYIIFLTILLQGFYGRNISIDLFTVVVNSVITFITDYIWTKSVYEFIVIICAVLIASSFFFKIRIRRIKN
ncbi:MAG: hypothetical protein N2746_11625 [Deltaproteobacteria bacterium]|nr:hypothetical protein [Deltaproteobacteria bacterium]